MRVECGWSVAGCGWSRAGQASLRRQQDLNESVIDRQLPEHVPQVRWREDKYVTNGSRSQNTKKRRESRTVFDCQVYYERIDIHFAK